jgi:hypothetical protein
MKPTTDPAPPPGEAREKILHEFVDGAYWRVCKHCAADEADSKNTECPVLLRRALDDARAGEARLADRLAGLSRWHVPESDVPWPEMSQRERRTRNALSELKSVLARMALGITSPAGGGPPR